jgi:hypothetical protein
MTRCAGLLAVSLVVASAGCANQVSSWLWPEAPPGMVAVPDHPFGGVPTGPAPTLVHAPATEAVTQRVNAVGQRLLAANAELPVRPMFLGIGSPDPQIFHTETTAIYVSDSLANGCTTEAQLAAVLASELGKMMATREALLALKAHRAERQGPIDVPIGVGNGGTFGAADGTSLAERGMFEKATGHGPAGGPPPAPLDPDLLARTYLKKAGFATTDLDAVAPLLREATKHDDIERQFTTGPIRPFVGQ